MPETPVLQRIHDVAAGQDGCISTAQLTALEVHEDALRSLVVRGALTRAIRGVYVLGARSLADRQLLWTALLAAGPEACISHWSAAALHGLLDPPVGEVWVTTPGRRGERTITTDLPARATGRPATIHVVSARLDPEDIVIALVQGLRVFDVARALLGLASLVPTEDERTSRRGTHRQARRRTARKPPAAPLHATVRHWQVRRAWHEADYLNGLRQPAVDAVLGRGVRGAQLLRRVMAERPIVSDDDTNVDTKTEFLLLEAMLAIGVERPLTNARLPLPGRTYHPDFLFRRARLVVEVDGGIHTRPERKKADRLRDAHMRSCGYHVLRIPADDVEADAVACAHRVAAKLAELAA